MQVACTQWCVRRRHLLLASVWTMFRPINASFQELRPPMGPFSLPLDLYSSLSVVIPTGGYADLIFCQLVHEPVFIGDAARPIALEAVAQRLRLPQALVAVAGYVLDQGVDAFEDLPVLVLPPDIVLPGALRPHQLHSFSSRSI